jgi:cytochrome b561
MTATAGQSRYDGLTITIHWVSAAIVTCLWLIGQLVGYAPRGPIRSGLWSTHYTLGILLAVLIVARIIWRLTAGRRLPPADTGLMGVAANLGHLALYALLVAVVALGLAGAFLRGVNLFGIVALPQIGNADWRRPVNEFHELAANAIAALALVHALAALFHRYVLRDGVLARMGLGRV